MESEKITVVFNGMPITQTTKNNFNRKLVKSGDCLLWTGYTSKGGYPMMEINKKKTTAQRISFMLSGGTIPDRYWVRTACKNKLCCNPDHLYADSMEKFE
jgi:hypothetical protein